MTPAEIKEVEDYLARLGHCAENETAQNGLQLFRQGIYSLPEALMAMVASLCSQVRELRKLQQVKN